MEQRRQILLIGLFALVMMLLWTWQKEHVSQPQTSEPVTAQPLEASTELATKPTGNVITVKTDVFEARINATDGELVDVGLLKFNETQDQNSPALKIFKMDPNDYFVSSNSFYQDKQYEKIDFYSEQTNYELQPNQNELRVQLKGAFNSIQVVKTFIFKRGSYEVVVQNDFYNLSAQPQSFESRLELSRRFGDTGSKLGVNSFNGVSYSTHAKPYEKRAYDKIGNEVLAQSEKGGWVAIQQPYYLAAWVPDPNASNQLYTVLDKNHRLGTIGTRTAVKIPEQGSAQLVNKLYVGPENADLLKQVAPHLELTIDYGVFWFIASALFWLLKTIHNVVPNWGVSIILVTVLIKAAFYKLSAKSYISMSRLKDLQPKIMALREQYAADPQKLLAETSALYRQEKINPMSGCFPMLVQIPVFIALYWVLVNSVELRQAPFMLWITDLSLKDPYYVLPILMMLSMFVQQSLNPPAQDPMQQKMMYFMPLFFGFLFMNFPAGLVLYWLVNNVLSIAQQWWIMKKHL